MYTTKLPSSWRTASALPLGETSFSPRWRTAPAPRRVLDDIFEKSSGKEAGELEVFRLLYFSGGGDFFGGLALKVRTLWTDVFSSFLFALSFSRHRGVETPNR